MPISFSSSQLGALKKVAKQQKLQAKADAISMIVEVVGQVASGIITTVYSVQNEKLRKQLEDQIQYLDEKSASELENALRVTQNQNDRLAFTMDFLSKLEGEKSASKIRTSIENKNLSGVMEERKKIIYIFGGIIVLLVGIVIIKKITK
tara:strand:+ start:11012 stop:11458 length:447 start_codon:yes stop_codon:yes gene_type:complete